MVDPKFINLNQKIVEIQDVQHVPAYLEVKLDSFLCIS